MNRVIKYFLSIVIIILFITCTGNQEINSLMIDIDAVVKENDVIQVFYKNNNSINFNEKETILKKVIGSKNNQKIKIIFPDSIKPNQIRMDFGKNIKQPEIVVNELKFSFRGKKFTAKGKEIYYLFRVDESNTNLNKFTGSLKRKNSSQINGPSLYPNGDKLYIKLNHLYYSK